MTWYDALFELCNQVGYEDTVDDILDTAIEEQMLSRSQAGQIIRAIGQDWKVDKEGCYVRTCER